MSAKFRIVNADGSIPCDNLEDAQRESMLWVAWAKVSARMRRLSDEAHTLSHDEPNRRIVATCAGMTSAYTY